MLSNPSLQQDKAATRLRCFDQTRDWAAHRARDWVEAALLSTPNNFGLQGLQEGLDVTFSFIGASRVSISVDGARGSIIPKFLDFSKISFSENTSNELLFTNCEDEINTFLWERFHPDNLDKCSIEEYPLKGYVVPFESQIGSGWFNCANVSEDLLEQGLRGLVRGQIEELTVHAQSQDRGEFLSKLSSVKKAIFELQSVQLRWVENDIKTGLKCFSFIID